MAGIAGWSDATAQIASVASGAAVADRVLLAGFVPDPIFPVGVICRDAGNDGTAVSGRTA